MAELNQSNSVSVLDTLEDSVPVADTLIFRTTPSVTLHNDPNDVPFNLNDPNEIKKRVGEVLDIADLNELSIPEVEDNFDIFDPSEPPEPEPAEYAVSPVMKFSEEQLARMAKESEQLAWEQEPTIQAIRKYFDVDKQSLLYSLETITDPDEPVDFQSTREEFTYKQKAMGLSDSDLENVIKSSSLNPDRIPEDLRNVLIGEQRIREVVKAIKSLPNSGQSAFIILQRRTNLFNIPSYLSRKGIERIWGEVGGQTHIAIEAAERVLQEKNREDAFNWTRVIDLPAAIGQTILEFAALPDVTSKINAFSKLPVAAQSIISTSTKFAMREAVTLPTEEETVVGKAGKVATSAGLGAAIGGAHKYIPNPFVRIPTVAGGFMGLTAMQGGSGDEILETGVTILGFEALGIINKASVSVRTKLGRFRMARAVKAARKHNPDLKGVPDESIGFVLNEFKKISFWQRELKKNRVTRDIATMRINESLRNIEPVARAIQKTTESKVAKAEAGAKALQGKFNVSPKVAKRAIEIAAKEGVTKADQYLSQVKVLGEEAAEKVIAEPGVETELEPPPTAKPELKDQGKLGVWEEGVFLPNTPAELAKIVNTVRKNEGKEAADIVKSLLEKGIQTESVHDKQNEILVGVSNLSEENRAILQDAGLTVEKMPPLSGEFIRFPKAAKPEAVGVAPETKYELSTPEGRKEASISITTRATEIAKKLGFDVSSDELFTTVYAGKHTRGTSHGDAGISLFLAEDATQEQIDRVLIHELGHTMKPTTVKGLANQYEYEKEGRKFEEEQITKLKAIEAPPPTVAKEIEYEKEAITEPPESPKVDTGKAGKVVPTGKLDPTNPKEALEITKYHAQRVASQEGLIGVGGIFEQEYDREKQEWVVTGVEYTSEQIDTAYRTVQKSVESPMPDTNLFVMPGKESQMKAIAEKMAKVKGVVKPKKKGPKPLTKPTALPKAKTKKEDIIKGVFVATDKDARLDTEGKKVVNAISGVKVEGDIIIATDGRRMFWAKGEWGKDGLYLDVAALKKGSLGKPTKEKVNFPKWQDIVPDISDQKTILVPSGGVYEDLDTVLRRVRQAASITTEESKGVTIIENKDGSLGFAAAAPEVGHVEINVNPGGKILGAVNPRYLLDAIKFHAIRGDRAFEFYFNNWDRPMLTKSFDGKTNTLTMPINVGEPSEAITKAISEGLVKTTGKGKVGFPGKLAGGEMPKALEPTAAKPVTAREIITSLSKALKVPYASMATHRPRAAAGWYEIKPRGIRQIDVRDLDTAAHEVGHHIDHYFKIRQAGFSKIGRRTWKMPEGTVKGTAAELTKLGKMLYGTRRPRGGYRSEGIAEYVRGYLTGHLNIEKEAPKFHKWFTEDYLPNNPEVAQALKKSRDLLTDYRLQGAEARIESQINTKEIKGSLSDRVKSANLWMQQMFLDEFAPLRKGMEEVGIERKELKPTEDPYELAVYFTQKEGARARQMVLFGTIDLWGNKTGKGLKEIMKPIADENSVRPFTHFVVAARSLNLLKRGINPGISKEDAQYVYDLYKDNEGWQETAKEITEWNHRVLNYLVQAGALPKESADNMIKANPIYVPFLRAFAKGEKRFGGGGAGAGLITTKKGVFAIKGSGREIIDPFESMITQTRRMIAIAHKSVIARSLANLEAKHRGLASLIWKVPAPKKATTFRAEQAIKQLQKMGVEVTGEGLPEPGEMMEGKPAVYDALMTIYGNSPIYLGKDNIIAIVQDGKKSWYEVSPDMYKLLQGLDKFYMPRFIDVVFGKAGRAMRLGATGLNASFGLVKNPIRDMQDTIFKGTHARGPGATVKGVAKDLSRLGLAKSMGIEPSKAAQEFVAMGGQISGFIGQDRKSLQHLKGEMLASSVGRYSIHTVKHPIDAIREVFGVSESGPRIQEYEKALIAGEKKYGKDSPDAKVYAFNKAQDQTINYSRHGVIGKWLNQMIPFWNANMQDISKVNRTFRKRGKEATAYAVAFLTLPALGLWWYNKDEEWYKELPAYEKANYLHVKIPNKDSIIRIPVPFLVGHIFQGFPVAVVDALYKADKTRVREFFKEVLKADVYSLAEWPAIISPVIDVLQNEDWAGRPIIPRSVEEKLPSDQYKEYTTQFAKDIGEIFEMSPAQIEHLMNSWSGGLYRRVAATAEMAAGRREKELAAVDIPVIGKLFLRDPYAPKASIEKFYKRKELLEAKFQSEKITAEEIAERALHNSIGNVLTELWKLLKEEKTIKGRKGLYKKINDLIEVTEKER